MTIAKETRSVDFSEESDADVSEIKFIALNPEQVDGDYEFMCCTAPPVSDCGSLCGGLCHPLPAPPASGSGH